MSPRIATALALVALLHLATPVADAGSSPFASDATVASGYDPGEVDLDVPPTQTDDVEAIDDPRPFDYGGERFVAQSYRNPDFDCGVSGSFTFLVAEHAAAAPGGADDERHRPLWLNLQGGQAGYRDGEGTYVGFVDPLVERRGSFLEVEQHPDVLFDHLMRQLREAELDGYGFPMYATGATAASPGQIDYVDPQIDVDTFLGRRLLEGHRVGIAGTCDTDMYLGLGQRYPNGDGT
ncbi:hypothetical protein B7486_61875, partial [cyanobacterium TDX16]